MRIVTSKTGTALTFLAVLLFIDSVHAALFLYKEAESATLVAPMTVVTDAPASGGAYVVAPQGTGFNGNGKASVGFSVSTTTTVYVWVRHLSLTASDDSFRHQMDSGTISDKHLTRNTDFTWEKLAEYPVSSGSHTFHLWNREDATGADKIFITDDSAAIPEESGSLSFEASQAALTSPFMLSSNAIKQTVTTNTNVTSGGLAAISFYVSEAGDYTVEGEVLAPSIANNSFFVGVNALPTFENVWHLPVSATAAFVPVSIGGSENGGNPPYRFTLSQGHHVFYLRGREANTSLQKLSIIPADDYGSSPPQPIVVPSADALVSSPFTRQADGSIKQTVKTLTPSSGGLARYSVQVPKTGSYMISAEVLAASDASNSLFVGVDAEPTVDYIWHIAIASEVKLRSLGYGSEILGGNPPEVFHLSAGSHTIYVRGREPNVSIHSISLMPSDTPAEISLASIEAEISAPFVLNGGSFSQPTATLTPTAGGRAIFTFNIERSGAYQLSANVLATTTGSNSLFVNVDAEPTDSHVWHIEYSANSEDRTVGFTGGTVEGGSTPAVFHLNPGQHKVYIRGREANVRVSNLNVRYLDAEGPASTVLTAKNGLITAPFQIDSDGAVFQPTDTFDLSGGLLRLPFNVPTTGTYFIKADVLATSDGNNSLFVNVDAEPTTAMVWHSEYAAGIQTRVISTGNLTAGGNPPREFSLTAGDHVLYVRGREDMRVYTFSVVPAVDDDDGGGTTPLPPEITVTPFTQTWVNNFKASTSQNSQMSIKPDSTGPCSERYKQNKLRIVYDMRKLLKDSDVGKPAHQVFARSEFKADKLAVTLGEGTANQPDLLGYAFTIARDPNNRIAMKRSMKKNEKVPMSGFRFRFTQTPGLTQACVVTEMHIPNGFRWYDSQGKFAFGVVAGEDPNCSGGSCPPEDQDGANYRNVRGRGEYSRPYLYNLNRPDDHGYNKPSQNAPLPHGMWVRFELEVRMNDLGKSNGWARMWANGTLFSDIQGLIMRRDHLATNGESQNFLINRLFLNDMWQVHNSTIKKPDIDQHYFYSPWVIYAP